MTSPDFIITDGTSLPLSDEIQLSGAADDYRWLTIGPYDYYTIRGSGLTLSQPSDLLLQLTEDGGSNWNATVYIWQAMIFAGGAGNIITTPYRRSDWGIRIAFGGLNRPGTSFRVELDNLHSADPTAVIFREFHSDMTKDYMAHGTGCYRGGPVNGIRLVPRNGTILGGQATLSGMIG